MSRLLQRVLAVVATSVAFAANAGGPLSVCSTGSALKYPGTGSVTLRYDMGNLGAFSKTTADGIVNTAIATWTNVPTATITLARGADLPVDVTTANYTTYINGPNEWTDGVNPVVYDTDGTLTDLLLGAGASSGVLGFAGSAYSTSPCQYVEGRAVINGKLTTINNAVTVYTTVLTHELGHFIGLDHTQMDSAQGLATASYPLMYPIAYRTAPGLHEDESAAISAIYPDTTLPTTYGTLNGTFTTAGGVPIKGANMWVTNNTTGEHFSSVSDYGMLGNGAFKMLLTPGTYTMHAQAVQTQFTGGSGVGPYSGDTTGLSFQPPLYTGANGTGTPMNVTMSSQFTISAGCTATITFRSDGSRSAGGCTAPIATTTALTSSANPSNLGQAVTFTAAVGASSGTPTGTVLFQANGTTIAGCSAVPLTGALTAACTTGALAQGASSIVASYSGSGTHAASSSSSLPQTVAVPSVVIVTGSSQFALVGSAFATPLQVKIQDTNGNALSNVVVTFTSPAPGPGVATAALSTTAVTTNAQGLATISATANAQEGMYSIQASISSGLSTAAFTLSNVTSLDRFADPLLFVMQQYRDFLGREGDMGGINFWANQISTNAATRAQCVENYFNSAEFQSTVSPVARLYFAYFNRIPDYAGLQYWINAYKTGTSLQQISDAFAGSPEFQSTYGSLSNSQFVSLVYQNVLGRAPDSAGLNYWTNQLNTAQITRGGAMLAFSESAEYQSASYNKIYVTMIYIGMLRRSPDQGGFDFWVGYMNSGNSGLALIQGFITSTEYHNRFVP